MKLFAPAYYKDFTCIADRCRHSCCIGWEIDIDPNTVQKYADITHPYGSKIKESIDPTDTPHFRLCEGERCPHLDGAGLCRIISTLGEGYLCEICREHPRFYNRTAQGLEVGIGLSCEEACRLILQSDRWQDILRIGEMEDDGEALLFDALPHRTHIYALLGDHSLPYEDRLREIRNSFDLSLSAITDADWRRILDSLEYLCADHRALFAAYTSTPDTTPAAAQAAERALAYFVFRHCSAAEDEADLRARLGFCLFCEALLRSLLAQDTLDMLECARVISEELEYSEDNTAAICNIFRLI